MFCNDAHTGGIHKRGGLHIDYKSALYRPTTRFLGGENSPLSTSTTKTALFTSPISSPYRSTTVLYIGGRGRPEGNNTK